MQKRSMEDVEMSVRAAERLFLRRWGWVFPVAGLLVAMLTGGGFWAWVDCERPWLDWRQLFTWRAVVLGGAGLGIIWVWHGLLYWRAQGWVACLLALAGFVAVESAIRLPVAQIGFWLTARARLYPDEWIPKEVVSTQFRKLEGRSDRHPGVIVSGSSQMIGVGIQLEDKIAPRPYSRRCSAGLMPVQILMMWPFFPFEQGDIFVQCRSSFDFVDQDVFGLSWYRAYDSWGSVFETMGVVGWKACVSNWRQLFDHILAATFEGWRMKNFALEVAMRIWGVEQNGKAQQPCWPQPKHELEISDWQQRAFLRIAEKLKDADVEMWVFEGDVNPALHTSDWVARQEEIRSWLVKGSLEGKWRWIGAEEHNANLLASDWQDSVHLNESGVHKLTEAIWRQLKPCMMAGDMECGADSERGARGAND